MEELRGEKLQLSQPAEAGWHFYADDADSQTADALASAWAEAFVAKIQAEIEAGNINEFVKLEATQAKNLPKKRSIPLSGYLLAGSIGFLTLAVFAVLFVSPKNKWKTLLLSMLSDFRKISRILWGATLLTLPVTSFRWFPFLGEGTFVRPLALYPLALLIPLLLIQWGRGKIKLNWAGALIPLGALVLFIFAVTSFGALLDPLPLRGQIYSGRAIRALGDSLHRHRLFYFRSVDE